MGVCGGVPINRNSCCCATSANLNVDFGSQPVQNVTIEVYTADDTGGANPAAIISGLGDISWADGGSDLETQLSSSSSIPFVGNLVTTIVEVTNTGLSPGEAAGDGEVEDYAITLTLGNPDIEAVKTVNAINDEYSIPGNDVAYTITVTNVGSGSVDEDTIFLVDHFPSDLEYVFDDANGNIAGTDEIIFTEITPTGLTFDPLTDVGFSTNTTAPVDFSECDDTVTSGVNTDIKFICFNPKGTLIASSPPSSFSFTFRARIR